MFVMDFTSKNPQLFLVKCVCLVVFYSILSLMICELCGLPKVNCSTVNVVDRVNSKAFLGCKLGKLYSVYSECQLF